MTATQFIYTLFDSIWVQKILLASSYVGATVAVWLCIKDRIEPEWIFRIAITGFFCIPILLSALIILCSGLLWIAGIL
jgi:hypothetical protein